MCRSDDDYRLLIRELKQLWARAENGELNYGKGSDVYRSVTADMILEMRFRQRLQYPGGRRVVRLYYSEPASVPSALVAAMLAAKPDKASGLDMQDGHMEEAQSRILKFLKQ